MTDPARVVLDHVSITVSDLGRSAPFWDAMMAALGVPCIGRDDHRLDYGMRDRRMGDGHTHLSIRASKDWVLADDRHWCLRAPSRAAVDAFHAAGLAAGGRCDGRPGLRSDRHRTCYAAFLRDPDGNRVEAICHGAAPPADVGTGPEPPISTGPKPGRQRAEWELPPFARLQSVWARTRWMRSRVQPLCARWQ